MENLLRGLRSAGAGEIAETAGLAPGMPGMRSTSENHGAGYGLRSLP
jgi:hypothetical protein